MSRAGAAAPRRRPISMRRLVWLLPLLAVALALPALWRTSPAGRRGGDQEAARRALAEGNRLVRDGDFTPAIVVYSEGWREGARGDAAGVLAYNLGTTLHRLDRSAEALLWYRRAEPLRPGDRWLADNLALLREELAVPRQAPPGPSAWLVAHRRDLAAAAVAAAWAALALLVVARLLARRAGERGPAPRAAGAAAAALAVVSLLAWAAPAAARLTAPRPAVLLAPCAGGDGAGREAGAPHAVSTATPAAAADEGAGASAGDGDEAAAGEVLPAGSEVWVEPGEDGRWSVAGRPRLVCPADSVALV